MHFGFDIHNKRVLQRTARIIIKWILKVIKYRCKPLKKKWLLISIFCSFFMFANSGEVNSPNYFLTHIFQVYNKFKNQDSVCCR